MSKAEVKKEKFKIVYIIIGALIIFSVGMGLMFSFVDIENLNDSAEDSDSSDDDTIDNSTDDDGG
ncbi:MAG: hypothetical protein R6U96_08540 [Promethearchaeia archaeon]